MEEQNNSQNHVVSTNHIVQENSENHVQEGGKRKSRKSVSKKSKNSKNP
ncbi:MAG: hypothetical protein NT02SARS_1608 [SAR86 cluster bacterium SAR86B]|uniref:Uncharacterized protein n=1 Tax=SAR86 cluster bacterium SAR86B TaxID=1123867 RepID=J5KE95_9GAMM|nr:MAG: hypothetical protein NT02SARS_1608 [SAR86 cluster bacterium SAR86B]